MAIEAVSAWEHFDAHGGAGLHGANSVLECLLAHLVPRHDGDATVAPAWLEDFRVRLVETITCQKCGNCHSRNICDPFLVLTSDRPISLQEAWEKYFEARYPSDFKCESCNVYGGVQRLDRLRDDGPKILWLQPLGVPGLSDVPRQLTLPAVVIQGADSDLQYLLHGVLLFYQAHWITVARHAVTGSWYLHIDENVQRISDPLA